MHYWVTVDLLHATFVVIMFDIRQMRSMSFDVDHS